MQPPSEDLSAAEDALRSEEPARAASILMDLIWQEPENATAFLLLTRALARKGDLLAAREALKQATKIDAEHPLLGAARMELAAAEEKPAPPAKPPEPAWMKAPVPTVPPPLVAPVSFVPLGAAVEAEGPPGAAGLITQTALLWTSRPLAWMLMLVLPAMGVSYGLSAIDLPPPVCIMLTGHLLALCGAFVILGMCGVYVFDRLFPPDCSPTPGRLLRYALAITVPVWVAGWGASWLIYYVTEALPSSAVPPAAFDLLGAGIGLSVLATVLLPVTAPALCLMLMHGWGLVASLRESLDLVRGRVPVYVTTHLLTSFTTVLLGIGFYGFFSPLLGDPASVGPILLRGAALGGALTILCAAATVTGLDAIALREREGA